MSAKEITFHQSRNLLKLTIIGQRSAFNTHPWLKQNSKL